MFNEINGEVLDTVVLRSSPRAKPGTELRLIKTKKGTVLIQSWSYLMDAWTVMYRYGDIEGTWASWKRIEKRMNDEKRKRKNGKGNSKANKK